MRQVDELHEFSTDMGNQIRPTGTQLGAHVVAVEEAMGPTTDIRHPPWGRERCEPDDEQESNSHGWDAAKAKRGPDDYFSKHKKVPCASRRGADGATKFSEWHDQEATCLASKYFKVVRWLSWAPIQKDRIADDSGGGRKLAKFPEALEYDRQIYDALKAGLGDTEQ